MFSWTSHSWLPHLSLSSIVQCLTRVNVEKQQRTVENKGRKAVRLEIAFQNIVCLENWRETNGKLWHKIRSLLVAFLQYWLLWNTVFQRHHGEDQIPIWAILMRIPWICEWCSTILSSAAFKDGTPQPCLVLWACPLSHSGDWGRKIPKFKACLGHRVGQ